MTKQQKILQSFRDTFEVKTVTLKNITKYGIQSYLIDVVGYSNEDLDQVNRAESLDLVDNKKELLKFSN